MANSPMIYVAPEDGGILGPEQFTELAEFFSRKEYANEGEEFLNDAIRTVDQVLGADEDVL